MFKFLLKFILVIFILLIIAFYSLSSEFATYATNKLAEQAAKKNIYLTFANPSFGLVNFKSYNLEVDYPRKGLRLNFERLKLSPNLPSLFSNSKKLDFQFRTFGGGAVGTAVMHGPKSFELQDLQVKNWELKRLPNFSLLSLESGKVSFEADSIIFDQRKIKEIKELEIGLNDIISNGVYLPQQVTKSFPLQLPAFTISTFQADINAGSKNNISAYQIDNIDLKSSLINLTGDLNLKEHGRIMRIKSANFSVQLSDEGLQQFGQFLPLISSQQLKSSTKSFQVKFSNYINEIPVFKFSEQP